jgi:hypothetical protein
MMVNVGTKHLLAIPAVWAILAVPVQAILDLQVQAILDHVALMVLLVIMAV